MKKNKRDNNNFFSKIIILIALIMFVLLIKELTSKKASSTNDLELNETLNVTEEENTVPNEEKNNTEKNKIDFLSNVTAPRYFKGQKNIKIPVIIYHAFGEVPKDDHNYGLYSNEARFEDNVKTLLDAGYTFINLEEVYKYNNGELALPEKVCVITMDDGWIGCYTQAFNVLKKYNVPATIFIINYFVGAPDYFSWDQMKEMFDSGLVKIHIHGLWHSNCTELSKEELISDYTTAHSEIEAHLGQKIQKIMAYPGGFHNDDTIKWLKEAGFEIQVLTNYGTVNRSDTLDMTGISRIRGELATGKQLLNAIENS